MLQEVSSSSTIYKNWTTLQQTQLATEISMEVSANTASTGQKAFGSKTKVMWFLSLTFIHNLLFHQELTKPNQKEMKIEFYSKSMISVLM